MIENMTLRVPSLMNSVAAYHELGYQDAPVNQPGYVNNNALHDLMARVEACGVIPRFPHYSHLYKLLSSKSWMAHLCLMPGLRWWGDAREMCNGSEVGDLRRLRSRAGTGRCARCCPWPSPAATSPAWRARARARPRPSSSRRCRTRCARTAARARRPRRRRRAGTALAWPCAKATLARVRSTLAPAIGRSSARCGREPQSGLP